jgi:hypothetical protein
MKRIAIGLATGALGMFLLAPCVKAQSWQDMQNDQNAIEEGHEHINHDRQELRNDLRNGDFGAAAREQAEINNRQAAVRERQEDLNQDQANQNYWGDEDEGYGHYPWHHGDDDDD